VKLALAQIDTTVGDLRGNTAKILESYHRGADAGAAMIVAPELAIPGYPPRDLLAKRRFVEDNLKALEELAAGIGEAGLLVGYVDINPKRPGKDYFNAIALLHRGKVVAKRYKTLLPTYDVFDEDRYFQPAESNTAVPLGEQWLGLTICEDIWTQNYLPTRLYDRNPVDELMRSAGEAPIIYNVSASPYHLGKEKTRFEMLRAGAVKHRTPLVYCNLVGGNDELIFDGNSMVIDAAGRLVARGAAFREDLLIVDLARASSQEFVLQDERAALHDALVLGLRDYATK
jgi:NAD+ synthase (glutamine-hydrolysing)